MVDKALAVKPMDKGSGVRTSIVRRLKRQEEKKKIKKLLDMAAQHLSTCDVLSTTNSDYITVIIKLGECTNNILTALNDINAIIKGKDGNYNPKPEDQVYLIKKLKKLNAMTGEVNNRLKALNSAKNIANQTSKAVECIKNRVDMNDKSNDNWRRSLSLELKHNFDPQGLGGVGTYNGSYGRHGRLL